MSKSEKERTTLYLNKEVWKKTRLRALEEDKSASEFVEEALKNVLAEN